MFPSTKTIAEQSEMVGIMACGNHMEWPTKDERTASKVSPHTRTSQWGRLFGSSQWSKNGRWWFPSSEGQTSQPSGSLMIHHTKMLPHQGLVGLPVFLLLSLVETPLHHWMWDTNCLSSTFLCLHSSQRLSRTLCLCGIKVWCFRSYIGWTVSCEVESVVIWLFLSRRQREGRSCEADRASLFRESWV